MAWILRKTDASGNQRRFVTPDGSHHAYTAKRENAKQFATREAAEREACGNETPERL